MEKSMDYEKLKAKRLIDLEERPDNQLVVKDNKLMSGRYDLSLNEQKFLLYCVSLLDSKNQEKFNIIKVEVKDFISRLDLGHENRHSDLKDLVDSLGGKGVMIEQKDGSFLMINWVSSIEYKAYSGVIEIEFSEKLIPYLLQLKGGFTSYELENIINMQSKHSIRVYELLKQYQNVGARRFTIKEFRETLGLGDLYEATHDLIRYVVEPSIEEINEVTDITIEYEAIRNGRPIHSLLFLIKEKDDSLKLLNEYTEELLDVDVVAIEMGIEEEKFTPSQIAELYTIVIEKTASNPDIWRRYARVNYNYVKERRKKVTSIFGYLKKAYKEDFVNILYLLGDIDDL